MFLIVSLLFDSNYYHLYIIVPTLEFKSGYLGTMVLIRLLVITVGCMMMMIMMLIWHCIWMDLYVYICWTGTVTNSKVNGNNQN